MAVLAFKAVYTLEVKRRENDRRILALYTEYVVWLDQEFVESHQSQDERYDGSPCPVSFLICCYLSKPQADRAPPAGSKT